MKVIRNFVFAGCTVLLLTQCASQDEIRKLNYQIRTVNQKVEEVKSTTVNQMQKGQASSVNKIDAVAGETQQLRALVEESDQKSSQLREQTKEDIAGLQAAMQQMRTENEERIKQLEIKVEQLADSLDRLHQARVQAAEQRARQAAKRAEEAQQRTVVAAGAMSRNIATIKPSGRKVRVGNGQVSNGDPGRKETRAAAPAAEKVETKPAKQVVTAAPAAPAGGTDLFSQGMNNFKAGKYKEAYRTFEQVLSSNPTGAKAAQILFYMGECLFKQGEYDLAILDYQKVISNHAKDSHTPAALLKQGMAFEKLTDHETAKIIYKKLMADFPNSSEAGLAKKRLANL